MQLFETENNPIPDGAHVDGLQTRDGIDLRYARWQATKRPSKGTVIILSGRTEFIEKYFETISDLRDRGFGVLIFDWRGQGGSSRMLDNHKKGYIEDFDQYIIDYNAILERVALPDCTGPYFVLGHSTGSLVAMLAAPAEKNRIQRMVLLSPLLALNNLPFSQSTLKNLCGTATVLGLGESYVQGGASTMETRSFKANKVTSDIGRFSRNQQFARQYPELVIGGATITWIFAACKAMDRLADQEFRTGLTIPTLLVSAGNDKVVLNRATEEFCDAVFAATHLTIDGARHELLQERDIYRQQIWAAFEAFVPGSL